MTESGITGAAIGLLCFLPIIALAQQPSEEEAAHLTCFNQDQEYTLAQQVEGCTALMDYWGKDPKLAEVYYDRGNAFFKLKDFGLAITDYTNAILLNPQYAQAYFERGMANRATGRTADADSDFARARQINPNVGSERRSQN